MIEYELLNGESVKAFNNYDAAKRQAEKDGLKLAEYGDVCGSHYAYCYWNQSGNRNESEKVICYYTFNKLGKPEPITEDELKKILFY